MANGDVTADYVDEMIAGEQGLSLNEWGYRALDRRQESYLQQS